jgi:alanine dehydrogenase
MTLDVVCDGIQWTLVRPRKRPGASEYEYLGYYPSLFTLLCGARRKLEAELGRTDRGTALLAAMDGQARREVEVLAELSKIADRAVKAAAEYLKSTQLLAREKALKAQRKVKS